MLNMLVGIVMVIIVSTNSAYSFAAEDTVVPVWLKNKIDRYQKAQPGIKAQLTEYDGRKVYYIPSRCCDIPSELYDEAGNLICHPNGGFAGGDGKCPSFVLGKKP